MVTTVHFFQNPKVYQKIHEEPKDDINDVKELTAGFIPVIFPKIADYYEPVN